MSDELTAQIIGAAIEVHRCLGPGLPKSIDEEALCLEMEARGVPHVRQKEVDVIYRGYVIKGQKIDVLVANQVVVELQAVAKLPDVATAQTLSSLKATGLRRALLLNFGEKRLVDGVEAAFAVPLGNTHRDRVMDPPSPKSSPRSPVDFLVLLSFVSVGIQA